ncbi:MAG: hypothetical protein HC895_18860 [Leptolyngbyaceae cyanobacterium SM1_3_5]|nr:hypothetical protein [Leptolyngbyaceae cyanobacterium SM1_3_5]
MTNRGGVVAAGVTVGVAGVAGVDWLRAIGWLPLQISAAIAPLLRNSRQIECCCREDSRIDRITSIHSGTPQLSAI